MASFGLGDRRALTSCKLSLLVALCTCFFTYKLQFTHVIKKFIVVYALLVVNYGSTIVLRT